MAEVEVRALGPDDVDDMVDLDEQSGYEVYDAYEPFVEDEDEENCYLWGVFADDELVRRRRLRAMHATTIASNTKP